MTSPEGKLTALACHPTIKVNKAEELTYLSTNIDHIPQPQNFIGIYESFSNRSRLYWPHMRLMVACVNASLVASGPNVIKLFAAVIH